MNYMGSKARFLKYILPYLLIYKGVKPYVEICGGGMNVISEICGDRTAYDSNRHLISMWQALGAGVKFNENISRNHYNSVRNSYNKCDGRYSDSYIGWIGYMASANGRFFEGGYAGISVIKGGGKRDYIAEKIKNIKKQIPKITGVVFKCSVFQNVNPVAPSIIYCDPPYKGTKQYSKECRNFDYLAYYKWCRKMVSIGHIIYMSEYEMPDDFVCIWQQKVKSSLSANGKSGSSKSSVEKLFVHKSQLTEKIKNESA